MSFCIILLGFKFYNLSCNVFKHNENCSRKKVTFQTQLCKVPWNTWLTRNSLLFVVHFIVFTFALLHRRKIVLIWKVLSDPANVWRRGWCCTGSNRCEWRGRSSLAATCSCLDRWCRCKNKKKLNRHINFQVVTTLHLLKTQYRRPSLFAGVFVPRIPRE